MKITESWWIKYSARVVWSVVIISSLAFWGVVVNSLLVPLVNGFIA